jgi:hypothetical protein
MNSAIPAVCVLVASFGLHGPAQEPDRRWTELERSQGLTVAIDVTDGSRFIGTLLRVEGHSLVLRVRGDDRRIERGRIRRITSKRRDSLKNGIFTGAVIGAGMAAGSSCYVGDRKCGKAGRAAFVAFGAALWSAIGAAIDASTQKRMTLYEAWPEPLKRHMARQLECELLARPR